MTHIPAIGSKLLVYRGKAKHTSGGLTKKDLMRNKYGLIVSRKKHRIGLKMKKYLTAPKFTKKKNRRH